MNSTHLVCQEYAYWRFVARGGEIPTDPKQLKGVDGIPSSWFDNQRSVAICPVVDKMKLTKGRVVLKFGEGKGGVVWYKFAKSPRVFYVIDNPRSYKTNKYDYIRKLNNSYYETLSGVDPDVVSIEDCSLCYRGIRVSLTVFVRSVGSYDADFEKFNKLTEDSIRRIGCQLDALSNTLCSWKWESEKCS